MTASVAKFALPPYYLWKAPTNGMPESSGHGITIIPGFGNWVLLHPVRGEPPKGAIHVYRFVELLETLR